ncbi:MAG: 3-mercaptopyruvate sulfurtransferase [Alphaproteobacteria bacterium MarineAlpha2_Bin1]|nr:MAG: 3-mercaptopyruvate sulfurtransferase [Alphaproteobacteria bacterium MarineAlpha2_Bin1]
MNSKFDLIETQWLADNLDQVVILDGSWYLPNQKRNPVKEFEKSHIPGSQFFDIDLISDKSNSLPHMIPDSQTFENHMDKLGIKNSDQVIIYDGIGLQSAARVWWTFKLFGHTKVGILNGGFPKWLYENLPVQKTINTRSRTNYKSKFNKKLVRNYQQVFDNIISKKEQVIDARSNGRFLGIEPEPRENIESGHIPGSLNLPFQELISDTNKTLKGLEEIEEIFKDKGITFEKPIVTTCGSGITASILAFCLHLIGYMNYSVYDGSWTEWGTFKNHPSIRKN